MDDKLMEKQIKKAKRVNYVFFAIAVALLALDSWKKCDRVVPSDEVVTFHLGRQYSLTLYGDGHAVATNGYAEKGSHGDAFYEIPAELAQKAADYIEQNGTKLDFEEGVTASMTMDSATESEG